MGDGISLATVAQQILQYADGTPFTSVIPKKMMERGSDLRKSTTSKSNNNRLPWYKLVWKLYVATYEVYSMIVTKPDDKTILSKGMSPEMVSLRQCRWDIPEFSNGVFNMIFSCLFFLLGRYTITNER